MMPESTSRVVPVGAEYAVEFETEHLDLRYGPYPTAHDAEVVRLRITAALALESLGRTTAAPGITSPPGAVVPRPVQEGLW